MVIFTDIQADNFTKKIQAFPVCTIPPRGLCRAACQVEMAQSEGGEGGHKKGAKQDEIKADTRDLLKYNCPQAGS